ncbi:hypothetical protein F8388_005290 [Cannabis sativa]|uniref:Fatty acid desaturase N-terminal domain-containing protein n=1 Tax=Cannabis sativa TaxID=3483 RepID=A0A7J6ELF6_CANSA|nr:hypothetical protein F8388_005290 [Cannabis sativa]
MKMGGNGENSRLERAPHTAPPFTLSQLKKAIPPHCFNRSLLHSFSYLLQDLFFASLFYYVATSYFYLPHPLPYLAWPLYWIFQGIIFCGVWVLGHDCGHHSFSDHQWVDDMVGFVIHSAILFPYFSFKYSHRFNLAGRPYDRFACHYYPYSSLYLNSERLHILISDFGLLIITLVLYQLGSTKGLSWVVFMYGMPLLIGNSILIVIAYLNHTHLALPHYDSSKWD